MIFDARGHTQVRLYSRNFAVTMATQVSYFQGISGRQIIDNMAMSHNPGT